MDRLFQSASHLLILTIIAISIARIVSVTASNGETPFLSANDRSRWSAVAALLEDQTFAIDRLLEKRDSKGRSRTWYSIDMVRHADDQGVERFYSSKPPLLSVIYAGITWPVTMIFQSRLSDYPLLIGRCVLAITNLLPMIWLWYWWRRTVLRDITDAWPRTILLLSGLFGTFLTTFIVTLNNHLHAAIFFAATIILIRQILSLPLGTAKAAGKILLTGIFAGLTVMCELPSLAWAATIPLILFQRDHFLKTWSIYLAGLAPVLLAIVGMNWYAHGDWRPPYYHREALGKLLASVNNEQLATELKSTGVQSITPEQAARLVATFDQELVKQELNATSFVAVEPARRESTMRLIALDAADQSMQRRFAVVIADGRFDIHAWNDWYDYPSSYWLAENKRGVDLGEASVAVYAWNSLLGHHGIFSLTPIFLLVIPGVWLSLRHDDAVTRRIVAGIAVVSTVCIVFYLARDQLDRNYGGVCSGFRWQFWLIPGWLYIACRAFQTTNATTKWWQSVWAKRLVEVCLVISIFSAWFAAANPWQHPWMYQLYLRLLGL